MNDEEYAAYKTRLHTEAMMKIYKAFLGDKYITEVLVEQNFTTRINTFESSVDNKEKH